MQFKVPSFSVYWIILLTLVISPSLLAQEWEELGPSPFPNRHHGIGFSANGYGYVISGSSTKDVWRYTPETDTWEQLDDYSNLFRGFGIGDMNGNVGYFGFGQTFGGPITGNAKDLWKFDGETESFEQLADCPCQPRAHPALVYYQDKIYMGLGGNDGNLGDWWEYDIETDSWTEKATFIGFNRHHPYQFVIDDNIYVGSGHFSDWFRYDPALDEWSQIANHPSYIRVAGAQFAHNGKGYTLSGVADYNNNNHYPMPTGEFWEYDPIEDSWTALTPHPGLSRWAPAYFFIDGWVYLVAGESYDGNHATYRYPLEPITTSLEEMEDQDLDIYPMPFKDYFFLPKSTNWVSVRILGITGQVVESPRMKLNQVMPSELEPGAYILELFDGENFHFQRIVKN